MARILIYKNVIPNGEYDIYRTIDYKRFREDVNERDCYNVGNRAWLQGILVALDNGENDVVFLTRDMTPSYINASFDFVVLPMANIFQTRYIADMERLAAFFSRITVPTYVIACGAQADSFDHLTELVESVRKPAFNFIRSIYKTGGEFALRGYFTKEFFEKLGFRSAVVTGCPSIYQAGEQLKIEKNIGKNPIKPIYNGDIRILGRKLLKNKKAVYFDQDEFYGLLFALGADKNGMNKNTYIRVLIKKYGYKMVELAMERRAMLFLDIPIWQKYLIENDFNFSLGTRIHGNIISILSRIPALLYVCDSRTREMAEFYDIPAIQPSKKRRSLEELYELADYKKFNAGYPQHYRQFENFLVKSGLVTKLGAQNDLFNKNISLQYVDWLQTLLEPYRSTFERHKYDFFLYDQSIRLSRRSRQIANQLLP